MENCPLIVYKPQFQRTQLRLGASLAHVTLFATCNTLHGSSNPLFFRVVFPSFLLQSPRFEVSAGLFHNPLPIFQEWQATFPRSLVTVCFLYPLAQLIGQPESRIPFGQGA